MKIKTTLLTLAAIVAAVVAHAVPDIPEGFYWTETANPIPEWLPNQVVYEINVRQYSEEGTFAAVEADLPRIKKLGVNTLWLMPIHPIGELNRKGELGSYYAVKDYYDVNPEFGDKAAFRSFMEAAHSHGMRVILDWVANHSAWDNPLTTEKPHLYVTDASGNFVPPYGTDWTDVIQFDVEHPELADYHAEAMKFWVEEFGVDGFRCDYAIGLPVPAWNRIVSELLEVRADLFMLAESSLGSLQIEAFDATYGWFLMHQFDAIAQGKAPANSLDRVLANRRLHLPKGGRELLCTSNHDENSWNGTVFERLGGGVATFAALTLTMDGIPLIYNGQEAGLDKRLEFFTKDPIVWKDSPLLPIYEKLVALRTSNPALFLGAATQRIDTTDNDKVYAFQRMAETGETVFVIANLTAGNLEFTIGGPNVAGKWVDALTGETVVMEPTTTMALDSWKFHVLTR
jgi:cyclomaltodextrinase